MNRSTTACAAPRCRSCRRAGETRPQLGLVGGDGHISYPVDTRPLPTVEAYDTLLTGKRNPT